MLSHTPTSVGATSALKSTLAVPPQETSRATEATAVKARVIFTECGRLNIGSSLPLIIVVVGQKVSKHLSLCLIASPPELVESRSIWAILPNHCRKPVAALDVKLLINT